MKEYITVITFKTIFQKGRYKHEDVLLKINAHTKDDAIAKATTFGKTKEVPVISKPEKTVFESIKFIREIPKNNDTEVYSLGLLTSEEGINNSNHKINTWLENSKKILTNKSQPYLEKEIGLRTLIATNYEDAINSSGNIHGTYHIIGHNQTAEKSMYSGFLHLNQISANRVVAEWVIDGEQVQKGAGFIAENILTIHFSYEGVMNNNPKTFKGIVVYELLNDETIHGHWSEKYGDNNYVGFEEGRKLQHKELILRNASLN